ncbi:receptor-type tyrosine-protein phosphatase alpha-like isoform X2 [Acanthaster planci]|uniref:protein-tyrosine-phosphatase n=1 Tax=Acanthaster planci TaxID=133434 RepID=A0A8B8A2M9_ACAPL|nr:receptor-type tyrosine-protein phosphatase alpha-like isoform X2 [Acanthaster planci]
MIYKRSRQTRSDEVNDDTKHQHMNKTFETDAAYQVPEPIPEPAPYTSLGDGVVSIKTSIKKLDTKPLTSRTPKNVTAYEIPKPTFEPSVYASINDEVAVKSSAASAEGRLKPKPLPTPSTLQVIAADDDAYEVPKSVICASVSDGEVKMSSEPSNARSLKPKHRFPPQKSIATGDSHEQRIPQLFSRISSVSVNELAEYIQKKERASQNGFSSDFKTLPDGQQHPANASVQPHNKAKNHYVDAVAYDHSRVVLEPLENDPHSDYINANYIDGCLEKDKYIATQGPTESTIGDFWRMVWQLNVGKIIMLTNPVESGKDGCTQYWPDSGFTNYSNIALSIVKEDEFPDYTVRVFQIDKFFSKEDNRLVTQFNFKNWPETKPPKPTSLLKFIRVANAEQSEGRTVVHCSNGVGRTGTYIALDSMLDQMQKERRVDVLGFIYRMRQKRINMVQTPEQYRFIFDALLVASKMVDTPYENIKESTKRMKWYNA